MRSFVSAVLLLAVLSVCAASAQKSLASPQGSLESARRVTSDEAWQIIKKGKAVIVDVRGKDQYTIGHVNDALLMPLAEISSRVNELPRDKMVITYDATLREHTSARAVLDLNAKGIQNAAALLGGYNAWVKAGYPTARQ